MSGERVERLRRNHRDEIDSAALYDAMASAEREERLAGVYRGLAAAERRHAASWADQREGLADLRGSLREMLSESPLTDAPRFVKHLEAAYRDVWKQKLLASVTPYN